MKHSFKATNRQKYLDSFSDSYEFVETDKYLIAIMPSELDEFEQFTFVNNLYFKRGGNHIDYVTDEIVSRIREKLMKKYKTIKPADIKNKLRIVCMMKDFQNVIVDAQSKETLSNDRAEIREFLGDINFDKFTRTILKNESIIEPIVEIYKIKEEQKRRAELKKADKKPKKIKNEKFFPPIGDWENLLIAEGDSASSAISPILGRNGFGYFSMFGVPPSVYEATTQKIVASTKLKDLKDITGIQYTSRIQEDLKFKNYIIATDQDMAGLHIRGLLLAYFAKFAPELFMQGRIKVLRTPIVIVKKKNSSQVFKIFFDLFEYKKWESNVEMKNYTSYYNKGLGSTDAEELRELIEEKGLDYFLETIELDDVKPFNQWMGKDSEVRKELLKKDSFKIELQ